MTFCSTSNKPRLHNMNFHVISLQCPREWTFVLCHRCIKIFYEKMVFCPQSYKAIVSQYLPTTKFEKPSMSNFSGPVQTTIGKFHSYILKVTKNRAWLFTSCSSPEATKFLNLCYQREEPTHKNPSRSPLLYVFGGLIYL